MSPGCDETNWSVDVLAPGKISDAFLMPFFFLPLPFHGLRCCFPNKYHGQIGGSTVAYSLGMASLIARRLMAENGRCFSLM